MLLSDTDDLQLDYPPLLLMKRQEDASADLVFFDDAFTVAAAAAAAVDGSGGGGGGGGGVDESGEDGIDYIDALHHNAKKRVCLAEIFGADNDNAFSTASKTMAMPTPTAIHSSPVTTITAAAAAATTTTTTTTTTTNNNKQQQTTRGTHCTNQLP